MACVRGFRPRALALAGTELNGMLQERRIFYFLGLEGEGPSQDYCMLGVGLVDHSRLLSPLLFFTPFILPEEMNGLVDGWIGDPRRHSDGGSFAGVGWG